MENATLDFFVTINTTSARYDELGRRHFGPGFISDDDITNLVLFWPAIRLFIVVPGLWANVINMRTFLRMGLKTSVTLCFFVLAISDFWTLVIAALSVPLDVLAYLDEKSITLLKIAPQLTVTMLLSFGSIFNGLNVYITLFLAVLRCLCIIKPLQFRDMFSRSVTAWILVVIVVICIVPSGIYMAFWKAHLVVNPLTNGTRYVLSTTQMYKFVRPYMMFTFYLVLPFLIEVVILGCLLVMARELMASARFRDSAITTKTSSHSVTDGKLDSSSKTDTVEVKRRSKERNAIMQVAIISIIFLVTTLPKNLNALLAQLVPEYRWGGRLSNLSKILANVRMTMDHVNGAVNFLVYYKYNTKFRKLCFGSKDK